MSSSRIIRVKDSLSFNSMLEEQAKQLALAFAGAGIYACYFNTGDEDLKWVVNIKLDGGLDDEDK